MARRLHHRIQRGQSFHHEGRTFRDSQEFNSNGVIIDIDWNEETFTVAFEKKEREEYSFDQIIGCWNESMNGYWHYVD